jgi:uncharacterized membrane protein YsdA (DUF1294 family)
MPPLILCAYYFSVATATFALMGMDKIAACARIHRIPEQVFFGLALVGGGAGILAGAVCFRHKVRKPRFLWMVGVPTALHVTGLVVLAARLLG